MTLNQAPSGYELAVAYVYVLAGDADVDTDQVGTWLETPLASLKGETPATMLNIDPEKVFDVAEVEFSNHLAS
jgi:hypothetical protein